MDTFSQSTDVERSVGNIMFYLIFGLVVIELLLQLRARTAVVGSRQRYVSLSLRRLTSWAINLVFLVEGVLLLAANQLPGALWYLTLGIFGMFIELRTHQNDDDWFNGRGTKIKAGVRRFMSRPRRRYAPAFG